MTGPMPAAPTATTATTGTTAAARRTDARISGVPGGRPMIFAHGYGCDQAMWRLVAPRFAATHRVVTFDLAGFGNSDRRAWSAERYATLDAYADDVLALIDELELHGVVFVGHSVSSMIGVLAANREPSRFAALVLVGPSPRYVDDPPLDYVGGFTAADIDELVQTVDSNHLSWSVGMAPLIMGNAERPELAAELTTSFCRVDPEVASAFVRATFLSDNRRDLAAVTTPTLILQCADDVIAPEQVGRFVHAQIAGSELVLLEATGHCPNLSAPDETTAAIRSYLERHDLD